MRLVHLSLVLASSLLATPASATQLDSSWARASRTSVRPDLTLRLRPVEHRLLAASDDGGGSLTPIPAEQERWLRAHLEYLDLRLRALEAEPRLGPILTEAGKGLVLWPPLGAVAGIVFGLGTGTGSKALLESLASSAALGAACGVLGVVVMALVTIAVEYRSVSRQRHELLEERDRCRMELRGIDPLAPSAPPMVTVRF